VTQKAGKMATVNENMPLQSCGDIIKRLKADRLSHFVLYIKVSGRKVILEDNTKL